MIFDIYNSLLPKQRFSLSLTLAIFQLLLIIIFSVNIIKTKGNYTETVGWIEDRRMNKVCRCYDPYAHEWTWITLTSDRLMILDGNVTETFLISKDHELIRGGFLYFYFEKILFFIGLSFLIFIVPLFVFYIIYVPM